MKPDMLLKKKREKNIINYSRSDKIKKLGFNLDEMKKNKSDKIEFLTQ